MKNLTMTVVLLVLAVFILSYFFYRSENFINEIPVYLVSLEKDIERRNNLLKYVTPNEYSSVDGTKLSTEILENSGTLTTQHLKNGEVACYLSHYNILNKIKNYKDTYSIILEDDVELDIKKLNESIKILIQEAPPDWEIIFIGHNYYEEHKKLIYKTNSYTFKKVSLVHGAQSYIIKNKSISPKVNTLLPIKDPIDLILPLVFTCYIVEPQLSNLSRFSSTSNTQSIM